MTDIYSHAEWYIYWAGKIANYNLTSNKYLERLLQNFLSYIKKFSFYSKKLYVNRSIHYIV